MRQTFLHGSLLFLAVTPLFARAPGGPVQQPHPLGIQEYLAELDRWKAECAALPAHPERAGPLRKSLPESWRVEFEGQVMAVPADWLQGDLQSLQAHPQTAAATSKRIAARLQALQSEADLLAGSAPMPRPEATRKTVGEILGRREFKNAQKSDRLAQYRRQLTAWLTDAIERLFGDTHIPRQATRTAGWILAVGLPLLILVWLISNFFRRPLRRVTAPQPVPASQRGWRDWAGRAAAAAAQGQFREAVRMAYWAGVYRLEESGVWQVDRARTPREYLRLIPPGHPQQPPLSTLTARFERIWYGGQMATAEDFDFTRTRLEELGCAFPSNPVTGSS